MTATESQKTYIRDLVRDRLDQLTTEGASNIISALLTNTPNPGTRPRRGRKDGSFDAGSAHRRYLRNMADYTATERGNMDSMLGASEVFRLRAEKKDWGGPMSNWHPDDDSGEYPSPSYGRRNNDDHLYEPDV